MANILLLAYEVEIFAIEELAARYKNLGHYVTVLQCDAWCFTDNIGVAKFKETEGIFFVNLEDVYKTVDNKSYCLNDDNALFDQWKAFIDFNFAFLSDPLLCQYRHNRKYGGIATYGQKRAFLLATLRKLIDLNSLHNFDYAVTINNNYAVKAICRSYFKFLGLPFKTILTNRISSRFSVYLDYGMNGKIDKSKTFTTKNDAESLRLEYIRRVKNSGTSYDEHKDLLKRKSQFLTKKLVQNFSLLRYAFNIWFRKPSRLYQKRALIPSLSEIMWFELITNTLNYFQWRRLKFETHENFREEFYFYPLQVSPESAILTSSSVLDEVSFAIEIANRLPFGVKLYVKEHPGMVGERSIYDHHRLAAVDNIVSVDPFAPNFAYLMNCKKLLTQCGTIALEAAVLGVKSVCFGQTEYSSVNEIQKGDILNFQDESHDYESGISINQYITESIRYSMKIDMKKILYAPTRSNFERTDWSKEIDKLEDLIS